MLYGHTSGAMPLSQAQLGRLVEAASSALADPVNRANRKWVTAYRLLLINFAAMHGTTPRDQLEREYLIGLTEAADDADAARLLSNLLWAALAAGAPIKADLEAAHRALARARLDGTIEVVLDAGAHFLLVWLIAGHRRLDGPYAESLAASWQKLRYDVQTALPVDPDRIDLMARCLAATIAEALGIDRDEEYRLCIQALNRAVGVLTPDTDSILAIFNKVFTFGMRRERDAESLAQIARTWLAACRESDTDSWIEIGVNYCSHFRNFDNPAISTPAERYDLLQQVLSQLNSQHESQVSELYILVLYLRCETLSAMSRFKTAVAHYQEVLDKLSKNASVRDVFSWEINHNYLRNVMTAAVLDEDASAAKTAYLALRRLGPNPVPAPDGGLTSLSGDAATLSTALYVVPFAELRDEAAELLSDAACLDAEGISRLGWSAIAVARVALASIEDRGDPDQELTRLLEACHESAREIAGNGPETAVLLRELDLDLALAAGDLALVRTQFLSIVSHNDLGLLATQSTFDLLSIQGSHHILLKAVDRIATWGQFDLASWLLDQIPCRAVRLGVSRDRESPPGTFQWDESTWPSMLSYADHPDTGDSTDVVVRFWIFADSLRLLVGSSALITIPGFTAISMTSATIDEDLSDAPAQRAVVSGEEVTHTDGLLADALRPTIDEATDTGARIVTVDFSGLADALPFVHEAIRCCQDRASRRPIPIVTRPGTRQRPPSLPGWSAGTVTHFGDWSGTLIGPWIEAAYAQDVLGHRARVLYPGMRQPVPDDVGDSHSELLVVSSHGYYANEQGARFGQLRFGSVSVGADDAIAGTFGSPRVAMLASCEVGRSQNLIDQQNGTSLPAVLLHKGVEQVTSPVEPVDDLASCILVTRTLYAMSHGAEAPDATLRALETIRNWGEQDAKAWIADIISKYAASPISAQAPWPVDIVGQRAESWMDEIRGMLAPLLRAFVITSW